MPSPLRHQTTSDDPSGSTYGNAVVPAPLPGGA